MVEHQLHALGEDAVDVADVAGVLQPGPHVRRGAYGVVGVGQQPVPAAGVLVQQVGELLALDLRGVEPAVLAGSVDDPGPVLGVRLDAHPEIVPNRLRVMRGAQRLDPAGVLGAAGPLLTLPTG
jgi:hypothetical protein